MGHSENRSFTQLLKLYEVLRLNQYCFRVLSRLIAECAARITWLYFPVPFVLLADKQAQAGFLFHLLICSVCSSDEHFTWTAQELKSLLICFPNSDKIGDIKTRHN